VGELCGRLIEDFSGWGAKAKVCGVRQFVERLP
jgi:hypothetical protein